MKGYTRLSQADNTDAQQQIDKLRSSPWGIYLIHKILLPTALTLLPLTGLISGGYIPPVPENATALTLLAFMHLNRILPQHVLEPYLFGARLNRLNALASEFNIPRTQLLPLLTYAGQGLSDQNLEISIRVSNTSRNIELNDLVELGYKEIVARQMLNKKIEGNALLGFVSQLAPLVLLTSLGAGWILDHYIRKPFLDLVAQQPGHSDANSTYQWLAVILVTAITIQGLADVLHPIIEQARLGSRLKSITGESSSDVEGAPTSSTARAISSTNAIAGYGPTLDEALLNQPKRIGYVWGDRQ